MHESGLETEFLVREWGRWARVRTGLRLGHARLRAPHDLRGSTVASPLISDACALWVDQCVAQVTPQRARDALVMRFVVGCSQRRIGRELGCHHSTVARLVDDAMHQVGEQLGG